MLNKSDFNKAVEMYSDHLYNYMLKLVKDKDEAKNWTQEAFTILWENKNKLQFDGVKSFLFTTAYRKMIDQYRKNKTQEKYAINTVNSYLNSATEFENKQLITLAFNQLDTKQKSIIMLRDYEGYDYQSIATICNTSLENVRVQLFRARKKMKAIVTDLLNDKTPI